MESARSKRASCIFRELQLHVTAGKLLAVQDWMKEGRAVKPPRAWPRFSKSPDRRRTAVQRVTWGYVKDANISAGSDCAWLDQIEYTIPGFQFVSPPILTNGTTRLNIAGTNGQRLILQASQDLKSWLSLSTNIVTGGAISVIDSSSTNYQNRAYRAIHRNGP